MKILSWNVNGLRAAVKKGFLAWLEKSKAEIVCLQEIKLQESQLDFFISNPLEYHGYFSFAKKKGYSGLAVYSKKEPLSIDDKIGFPQFDNQGRFLRLDYPEFVLINLYLPHGQRDKGKLGYKLRVYDCLFDYLEKLKNKKLILAGDFNIAHTELDLARPKDNLKNIMFTPTEREQISRLIDSGFFDSFRKFCQKTGFYTWWPYRLKARQRNLGWRIDYFFVSQKLAFKLKDAFILSEIKGSDHCPIGIEIKA